MQNNNKTNTMRTQLTTIFAILIGIFSFAQSGHIMQGIGAVNMSMGGAATAQPTDINGAIQWNPAAIAVFDGKIASISIGAFYASPELSSSIPAGMMGAGSPAVNGTVEDELGMSPMPALAFVWSKPNSNHTFGASVFGVSGFGVDFPEETNSPLAGANFNPNESSSPINYPQTAGGFGHITSNYMMVQTSLTYAYSVSKKVSFGLQPNFNYHALELGPNPTANPDLPPALGGTGKLYPTAKGTAMGYGAQVGVFYDSKSLLKLGMSYKTRQYFSEFTFENTYLDGSTAPDNTFTMNYPSILSFGMGLSGKKFDFATDVRFVNYENTEGFKESGWKINDDSSSPAFGHPTGAVNGFGWKNMTIFSIGLQYKIKDNIPIRIGYTNNTNPIKDSLTFYSVSAPAVVTQAAQIGLGYTIGKMDINLLYHKGFRGDGNSGTMLSPNAYNSVTNPLGKIPGTNVSYDMETSMFQVTLNYKL